VYTQLAPRKADFDMVRDMMMKTGVLKERIPFEAYTDTRFADGAQGETPWQYQPGLGTAR
jgi:NitT/TauT family transport system substrate-binding protein